MSCSDQKDSRFEEEGRERRSSCRVCTASHAWSSHANINRLGGIRVTTEVTQTISEIPVEERRKRSGPINVIPLKDRMAYEAKYGAEVRTTCVGGA